jgi:hypothetical protein
MTKPTITAITGSNPSGPGAIAADPRLPFSVQVQGTGFGPGLVHMAIFGPNGWQTPWPANVTDTGFDIIGHFPVAGQYTAAVAIADSDDPASGAAVTSDWFSFRVI